MKYEINVGLNSHREAGERASQEARAQRVSNFLHYFADDWQCRIDWDADEPTLVGRFDCDRDEDALLDALYCLAASEDQDCVALLYDDDIGGGRLIGPAASEWGPFNLDYFVRF